MEELSNFGIYVFQREGACYDVPVWRGDPRGPGCGLNGYVAPAGADWEIEKVAVKVTITPGVADNVVRDELPKESHALRTELTFCEHVPDATETIGIPQPHKWVTEVCPSRWG